MVKIMLFILLSLPTPSPIFLELVTSLKEGFPKLVSVLFIWLVHITVSQVLWWEVSEGEIKRWYQAGLHLVPPSHKRIYSSSESADHMDCCHLPNQLTSARLASLISLFPSGTSRQSCSADLSHTSDGGQIREVTNKGDNRDDIGWCPVHCLQALGYDCGLPFR